MTISYIPLDFKYNESSMAVEKICRIFERLYLFISFCSVDNYYNGLELINYQVLINVIMTQNFDNLRTKDYIFIYDLPLKMLHLSDT